VDSNQNIHRLSPCPVAHRNDYKSVYVEVSELPSKFPNLALCPEACGSKLNVYPYTEPVDSISKSIELSYLIRQTELCL
jgi:hypothetical protein